jgi:hypothetical protein
VEAINDDGKEVIKGVKLKGLSMEKALEKIIHAYDDNGYFIEQAELYISTESKNDKKTDKTLSKLEKKAKKVKGDKKYNVNVIKLSKDDKKLAKDLGISPGKYKVILEIIEKNPTLTVDELKDKSMSELKSILGDKKNK